MHYFFAHFVGRKDFEKMTSRRYEYIKGLNGHFEMALYTFLILRIRRLSVQENRPVDDSVAECTTRFI